MTHSNREKFWRDIRYGTAAFALGMPTIPLLIYLPPIYAENLGLGLTATGMALFAARFLDVVTDPLIGAASDRITGPFGRRKPLIALGTIIAAVGIILLLNPPEESGVIYLVIWSTVLYLGWTMINIPYLAWASDLHKAHAGRVRVTSIRESFMLAGIMFAGGLSAILTGYGTSGMNSLTMVGWCIVIAGAIAFPILLGTVQEPAPRPLHARDPFLSSLKDLARNSLFNRLLASWFINSLANGIPAVLFILYMKHVINVDEFSQGILTLIYFIAGIAGMPLWVRLSRYYSKHRIWCIAMILASATFATVPLLETGDVIPFGAVVIFTGLCLGADLAIPPAMQADVAEYEYFKNRHDRTGILFSVWSMSTKLALAASVGIAFPLLEWLGTEESSKPENYNLMVLALIYAGLPVVLKLGSILLIWNFPLNQGKQKIIQRRLTSLEQRNKQLK